MFEEKSESENGIFVSIWENGKNLGFADFGNLEKKVVGSFFKIILFFSYMDVGKW